MMGYVMTVYSRLFKMVMVLLLAVAGFGLGSAFFATHEALAAPTPTELPTAAGSPIAGINFDDRPFILPSQRNFQMAMITASSELGRSCGRMESYGWRLDKAEQTRVNLIFNNTVDRLRAQGFAVESKAPQSVSPDITLFTADRADKHLIFLWSAGDVGLVMVMCETSAPLSPIASPYAKAKEAEPAYFGQDSLKTAQTVRAGLAASAAAREKAINPPSSLPTSPRTERPVDEAFTPQGKWTGSYTCSQGTTGATLTIKSLKGEKFDGEFSFYPTSRNPLVPKGRYRVFGEYDKETQRILINPGQWIDRPKGFYNTIMIGSFDSVAKTFSGFFQGITGCTSFEASFQEGTAPAVKEKAKPSKKKVTKKKVSKKKETVKPKAEKVDAPKPEAKASDKPVEEKVEPTSLPVIDEPAPTIPDVAPEAKSENKTPAAPANPATPEPAADGIVIDPL
jgi:hypothetical protein